MTEQQNKISRRDWFRLRPATAPKASGELVGHDANHKRLKPIEHPPNHDGMDLSELPPMREAALSAEEVKALVSDIGTLCTDIMLMQRSSSSQQRATAAKLDSHAQLEAAKTSLLSGQIKRVQIRYRWNGFLWIDTLAHLSDSWQLVRIKHA